MALHPRKRLTPPSVFEFGIAVAQAVNLSFHLKNSNHPLHELISFAIWYADKIPPDKFQKDLYDVWSLREPMYIRDVPLGIPAAGILYYKHGYCCLAAQKFSEALFYLIKAFRSYLVYYSSRTDITIKFLVTLRKAALMAKELEWVRYAKEKELSLRREINYYNDLVEPYGYDDPYTKGIIAHLRGNLNEAYVYYRQSLFCREEPYHTKWKSNMDAFQLSAAQLYHDGAKISFSMLLTDNDSQVKASFDKIKDAYTTSSAYYECLIFEKIVTMKLDPDICTAIDKLNSLDYPACIEIRSLLFEYRELISDINKVSHATGQPFTPNYIPINMDSQRLEVFV